MRNPQSSQRQDVRDATRARILAVAMVVFGQDPAAGLEDVAAAAGIVRRTVYGHFSSRQALVHELVRSSATRLRSALADAIAAEPDPARAWVRYVRMMWPLAPEFRGLLRLRQTSRSEDTHALLDPLSRDIVDLIRAGQQRGCMTNRLPAQVLAATVIATVIAVLELSDDDANSATAITASTLALGIDPGVEELRSDHSRDRVRRQQETKP